MTPYPGVPVLHIALHGAYFEPWGDWYRNFEYAQESARGLDFREDQYSPGFFTCTLDPGETGYLAASVGGPIEADSEAMMEAERERRAFPMGSGSGAGGDDPQGRLATYLGTPAPTAPSWEGAPEGLRALVAAADAFLVRRGDEGGEGAPQGVVAGYHWFEEWGRDAMISLPGVALVTGRFGAARSVLRTFAEHCSEGMIPNRIPDAAERPEYNTVDATLWMFWAAHKYLEYTGDRGFVLKELAPVFSDVVAWHVRGTRYGIKVDGDGLVRAGEPGTQLTWMDAKVGDWVVTPREGKPVEINALWHHALRFLEELGVEHAGPGAEEVAREFAARFWNERVGHLNDVVDGTEGDDASLRPNQIFAVSLPYPILDEGRARRVVDAVKRDLLTPYGLRTLSPHDPRYRGRYEGDQRARDGAYHQGTVWPWLLGPFISAHVGTSADRSAARREARGRAGADLGGVRRRRAASCAGMHCPGLERGGDTEGRGGGPGAAQDGGVEEPRYAEGPPGGEWEPADQLRPALPGAGHLLPAPGEGEPLRRQSVPARGLV
jgi:glycogen debranching enzyme